MASEKQIQANRQNAKHGGVKTPEGKEIIKRNALKHGLLSKEVVITDGEGAESQEEFDALMEELVDQFKPANQVEMLLVEKIGANFWRLKRLYRYESGLVRKVLDTVTDDYYGRYGRRMTGYGNTRLDEEIQKEIDNEKVGLEYARREKMKLEKEQRSGTLTKDIGGISSLWERVYVKALDWFGKTSDTGEQLEVEEDDEMPSTEEILKYLKKDTNWTSEEKIWPQLLEACDGEVKAHEEKIIAWEKEMERNHLNIQVIKRLGVIPGKEDMDRLLRYEGAIERQFYRAMSELERLQRIRSGDRVAPPVNVNVDVTTDKTT